MMSKNKSQVWSLDSIIASVIFVTSVVIFILILTNNYSTSTQEDAQRDNNKILQIISGTEDLSISGARGISTTTLSFLIGPNVNLERLKELQEASYNDLKSTMGIRGNFCIFFEDLDGNIINISEYTGSNIKSVGLGDNRTFLLDNVRCANE